MGTVRGILKMLAQKDLKYHHHSSSWSRKQSPGAEAYPVSQTPTLSW